MPVHDEPGKPGANTAKMGLQPCQRFVPCPSTLTNPPGWQASLDFAMVGLHNP